MASSPASSLPQSQAPVRCLPSLLPSLPIVVHEDCTPAQVALRLGSKASHPAQVSAGAADQKAAPLVGAAIPDQTRHTLLTLLVDVELVDGKGGLHHISLELGHDVGALPRPIGQVPGPGLPLAYLLELHLRL